METFSIIYLFCHYITNYYCESCLQYFIKCHQNPLELQINTFSSPGLFLLPCRAWVLLNLHITWQVFFILFYTFSVNSRFLALCSSHLDRTFWGPVETELLLLKAGHDMLRWQYFMLENVTYLSRWKHSPHKGNKNCPKPRTELLRWQVFWDGVEHSFKPAIIKLLWNLTLS